MRPAEAPLSLVVSHRMLALTVSSSRGRWCQTQPCQTQSWVEIQPRKVLWKCVFRNQEECRHSLSRCCVQTQGWVLCITHYPTCPVRLHTGHWWEMRLRGRKVKASGNSGPEPRRNLSRCHPGWGTVYCLWLVSFSQNRTSNEVWITESPREFLSS